MKRTPLMALLSLLVISRKQVIYLQRCRAAAAFSTTSHQMTSASSKNAWKYIISQVYKPVQSDNSTENRVPHILHNLDPSKFPSVSQARKSCRQGRILMLPGAETNNSQDTEFQSSSRKEYMCSTLFTNLEDFAETKKQIDRRRRKNNAPNNVHLTVCTTSSTTISPHDLLILRDRDFYTGYHMAISQYMHPPRYLEENDIDVLFENDHFALVNKPEYMTTIGGGTKNNDDRGDLQSMLPFLLQPPKSFVPSLPRPVHRLDRQTSGLVLNAKSKESMSYFSQVFAKRRIEKTYVALVFGCPKENEIDEHGWNEIDYPIDGKHSVTRWKKVTTVHSEKYGDLTLLHCCPKTGRYHQIRRHLSYCLGTPIVGAVKYDGGGSMKKLARSLGMFLCSNAIYFPCPIEWCHQHIMLNINQDHSNEMRLDSIDLGEPAINFLYSNTTFDEFTGLGLTTSSSEVNSLQLIVDKDGSKRGDSLYMRAKIPLPPKFNQILNMSNNNTNEDDNS